MKVLSPHHFADRVLSILPVFTVSWSSPGLAKEMKETDEEKPINADELTGARQERPEYSNQAEV